MNSSATASAGALAGKRRDPRRSPASGVRTETLSWALAGFCAFVGLAMLIVPHRFAVPTYLAFQPALGWWGVAFVAAGYLLVIALVYAERRLFATIAHLIAGAIVLLLVPGLLAAGLIMSVPSYGTIGIAMMAVPIFSRAKDGERDLFAIVMGLNGIWFGLVMLLSPQVPSSPVAEGVRPLLPLLALLVSFGGGAMVASQLTRGRWRNVLWILALAVLLGPWLLLLQQAWQGGVITGIAYYTGFAAMVLALPWIGPRLVRIQPAALAARIGVGVVLLMVALLTTISVLSTQQTERTVLADARQRQLALSSLLADRIEEYVLLHQRAVFALASQPGLLARTEGELARIALAFQSAYPDLTVITVSDREGRNIGRSDGRPLVDVRASRLFRTLAQSGTPIVMVGRPPESGGLALALAVPVRDQTGAFAGMVAADLESHRIIDILVSVTAETGQQAFVFDDGGRLVVHSDPTIPSELPAISTRSEVWSGAEGSSFAAVYRSLGQDWLAALGPTAGLGWSVVLREPVSSVLAGVSASRDLALVGLLGSIAFVALATGLIAGRMTAPVARLAQAMQHYAAGGDEIVLPISHVREFATLSGAFRAMRDRLDAASQQRALLFDREQAARRESEALAEHNATLYQQTQEAVQARDEFLLIAAHELRTPVAGLRGSAQLLARSAERGTLDVDRLTRYVPQIIRGADRLTELIRDLLDVARLNAGRLDLNRTPTDVVNLLRQVGDEQSRLAGRTIVYELPGSCVLTVDAGRIEQVLVNLIGNAVKYSPAGGPVVLRLSQADGVTISVSDDGIGLPPGAAEAIFTPFGRAANAQQSAIPGMGLGLYICRQIVESHGGRIWAESEGEGKGTRVSLWLKSEA